MNTENINISEIIISSINNLFSNLFSSIDKNIYPILDNITFIDENIMDSNYLSNIFGVETSSGILIICNSLVSRILNFLCFKFFYISFYIP